MEETFPESRLMYIKQMKDTDSVETLIRSAREGDRKAFKTLYDQYKQPVYRTAYKLLGDRMLKGKYGFDNLYNLKGGILA